MKYEDYTKSPEAADSAFVEPSIEMPYLVLTEEAKNAVKEHSELTGIPEKDLEDCLGNLAAWVVAKNGLQ